MAAFATVEELQGSFPRPLSVPEKNRARYLLEALANRIREMAPETEPTSENARAVSIDIVLHALILPMDLIGHTSYSKSNGARSKAGSIDPTRIGKLVWEDWHYALLGIDTGDVEQSGDPAYYFGDGEPDCLPYGRATAGLGRPSAW